jgi:hypothetical protein|tara:strand:- start:3156 stop:3959 length:804 start_codon:yes stop_codon:yes gene_type:complete
MDSSHKIVVFDLDETLGYFTEFGIFCDCLNTYFKNNNYSERNFDSLLDLYPEFVRPKLFKILDYLKTKKMDNKCKKIMIYTNNQGPKSWAMDIKKYFNTKLNYKLFDQIIAAFKVKGKPVEIGRTSHDKTIDDLIRCTKIPQNVDLCFIDDVYHDGMVGDKVYYIHVKAYKHSLTLTEMLDTYLKSDIGNKSVPVKDRTNFETIMENEFKRYNYDVIKKTEKEQDIDNIVGKMIMQHLKKFFYEQTDRTYKRKPKTKIKSKNKTVKR